MHNKLLLSILSILVFFFASGCGIETTTINHQEVSQEDDSPTEIQTSNESSAEDEKEDISTNISDGSLENLSVHYIDVGQADSILFNYSYEGEDFRILYDTGNWNRNDVVQYLDIQKIEHIDIIIISHPHADHIGQLDKILDSGISVSEVWMSGDISTSQTFERAMDAVERSGADYHEPRAGEVYDIGPLVLEIINPEKLTGDVHKGSVSMRVQYGEVSFLFTGDAERQTEEAMLKRGHHLDADILKLGHHGSNTSTTSAFLQAVNPKVAIYSAGVGNNYGHPHDEVLTRVMDAGVDLYGTDIHGTIVITTNGDTFDVQTKMDGTISPTSSGETASKPEVKKEDPETATPSDCININTASFDSLQEIKHIGPARAEELISKRPFQSIDSLSSISGIGAGRLADIKNQNLACVR
ncbi:MBL fold metallo-hydrolase [Bacillus sp. FJAT-45066]|uniref:MBL fold metallo-hydrolase n=1 Tax=Bacillus sp. FJAT-45066 TaxID=2011010 RepID=UPI000BB75046|nr:MBL fold metallo-hydrolase [Bacillus sp. FJAT-45066]